METNKKQVGMRIKDIRLSLGESMEEFGKRFDTSKGTVNNWEKGRNLPNKSNLLKIAKLGKMTPSELLKGDTYDVPFKFPKLNQIILDPSDERVRECYEIIIFNTSNQQEEDVYISLIIGVICILKKISRDPNKSYTEVLRRDGWVAVEGFFSNFFVDDGGAGLRTLSYEEIEIIIDFLQRLIDYYFSFAQFSQK